MQTKTLSMLLLIIFIWMPGITTAQTEDGINLLKAPINISDILSLQRGAKLYINYCSGCHSLNFIRYNRVAQDLKLVDKDNQIDGQLLKNNLIFTGAKISDPIQTGIRKEDAKSWFGVAPPDLSLIARSRGSDWLYTYLLSFYRDRTRPFGANNLLFNETAMPDVLVLLRGTQIPVYQIKNVVVDGKSQQIREIKHLVITESGTMSPQQFNTAVADIVNFLTYVGEPTKPTRQSFGIWVVGYLILFAAVTYFLKKEYWKKIK